MGRVDSSQKLLGKNLSMAVTVKKIIGFGTRRHRNGRLFDVAASLSHQWQSIPARNAKNQRLDHSLAHHGRHLFIKGKEMLLGVAYIAAE